MMQAETSRPPSSVWRNRWAMPAFCLFLGALMLAAFAIGGDVDEGLRSFAVMAAVGALFLFGRRSETLQGIGGPGRDERWAMIDLRATAMAGVATITFVIGAWLLQVARGEDGTTYALIGAVAGLAYILAVAYLRFRS